MAIPDQPTGASPLNAGSVLNLSPASLQRITAILSKIATFGVWQIAAQGLQLFSGFLLLRWLSVEAYAQLGLVLSFQNMLVQLAELGFSSAILALVGPRIYDRAVVGAYLSAAWSMRFQIATVLLPAAALAFTFFARSHHWPTVTSILLFGSIAVALFLQGVISIYSPVLLMHRELERLYRPQLALGLARLATTFLLHTASVLGAVIVSWLNVATLLISGFLYRNAALSHVEAPSTSDPIIKREFRQYLAPLVPGIVFYAFQGQIQMFLISAFGKTQEIAEVAALGRLSQLFIFISAFNGWVLVPYIARVEVPILARRYLQFVFLGAAFGATLVGTALLFPRIYLWLLGPKYLHLHASLAWCLAASSLGFLTSMLYSFNNARRWVYHWSGTASIAGSLLIQASLLAILPLDSTVNVMIFSTISTGYPILPFVLTAYIGYRRTMRDVHRATA